MVDAVDGMHELFDGNSLVNDATLEFLAKDWSQKVCQEREVNRWSMRSSLCDQVQYVPSWVAEHEQQLHSDPSLSEALEVWSAIDKLGLSNLGAVL